MNAGAWGAKIAMPTIMTTATMTVITDACHQNTHGRFEGEGKKENENMNECRCWVHRHTDTDTHTHTHTQRHPAAHLHQSLTPRLVCAGAKPTV